MQGASNHDDRLADQILGQVYTILYLTAMLIKGSLVRSARAAQQIMQGAPNHDDRLAEQILGQVYTII